jgi:hypothetical protein
MFYFTSAGKENGAAFSAKDTPDSLKEKYQLPGTNSKLYAKTDKLGKKTYH